MSQLHIADALRDFLNKSKLKSGLRAVQIESIWEELMGKTIARYTDKIQIVNSHSLYLHIRRTPETGARVSKNENNRKG
jgi:hypothetical protein